MINFEIRELAAQLVEYLAAKISGPKRFVEYEERLFELKEDLKWLATVYLDLNEPYVDETEFEYLLPHGDAWFKAQHLRDILEKELFTKGQLAVPAGRQTTESPVFRVYCWLKKDPTGVFSSSWKEKVQATRINMANVGVHGETFVVWGQEITSGGAVCLPYISLATLRAPSMSVLDGTSRRNDKRSGMPCLVEEILRYLRMRTSDLGGSVEHGFKGQRKAE